MSNIDKQALRERYSEKPAPKCHICGSVMTIQRASAGSVVYGCDGRIDGDGEGYKFEAGRDFADDHYARSRVTEYGLGGDPDVLALLDELEAAEKQIAEMESLLSAIGKSRPGGAYFCKWDGKINEVLNHGK
ncbi:ead/Ea22-like family protein [Citrobacter koseri]|uniref:ead/Ea22-like family protein n=1 Tax=Citrobacter koseri TaxID=545 RepID=UPI0023B10DE6|nr:ead/Ea22-like family protein [Citrobacter koseri]